MQELSDSYYAPAGGQNTDFHFKGDGIPDTDATVKPARERDAIRLAAATEGDQLICVIDQLDTTSLDASNSVLRPPPGGSATIKVKVTYRRGGNHVALPGMPVKWVVTSGAGALSCPSSPCYTEVEGDGEATVYVSGPPGTSTISASLGPPLNPADCAGVDAGVLLVTVTLQ